MKITLTQAQMLSLWRRAQGLEPTAAAVSLEQWDSIDTEAQLALRMRQWYLRLLDTGDETLVATSDISTQISLRRVGDGLYAATLPATCRRLLRLNVTDECGTSMVVPDAVPETAVTRYRRRRANPWERPPLFRCVPASVATASLWPAGTARVASTPCPRSARRRLSSTPAMRPTSWTRPPWPPSPEMST